MPTKLLTIMAFLSIDRPKRLLFGKPWVNLFPRVSMVFDIPGHFTGGSELEGNVTDSPVWARLLSHNIDPDRATPMELPSPFESRHTYRFHLPPAYVLDALPASKAVKSKWGSFERTVRTPDPDWLGALYIKPEWLTSFEAGRSPSVLERRADTLHGNSARRPRPCPRS